MKFNFNKILTSLATSVLLPCSTICFAMEKCQYYLRWDINNNSKKHDKAVTIELQSLMPLTIFDITENEVKHINLELPEEKYSRLLAISTGSPILKELYVREVEEGNFKPLSHYMVNNDTDIGNIYVYFGCGECDSDPNNSWPPKSGSDFLKAVTCYNSNGFNEVNRYLISINDAMAEMLDWGTDPDYANFFLYHTCSGESLDQPHVNNGHIYVVVEGEICEDLTKHLNKAKVDGIVSKFQRYLKYCLERVRKAHKGNLLGSGN